MLQNSQAPIDATINAINNHRHYMGLQNLGNTCYMNSLLQTLFMTPQFREALFKWQYLDEIHPAKVDCIPLQLQILFARMQQLSKDYKQADARELIKSFQWDPQESFQQHDVQEFCRVLFDAISQSCSEEKEFINKLYESHSVSYVKCLKCSTESIRSDVFMDLSLTVKSEFDNVYNESLEKALKHYLKPDYLTDDNLYMCENCQEKVEAVKGLRFSSLSEILTIQLNRFELDMETFNRKKVNNWVSYPFILDMNNFMQPYDKIEAQDDTQFLQERDKIIQNDIEKKSKQQDMQQMDGNYDDPLRRRRRENRKPSPEELKKEKDVKVVTFGFKDDFEPPKKQINDKYEELSLNEFSQIRLDEKYDLKKSAEQLGQKFDQIKKQTEQNEEFIDSTQQKKQKMVTTFTTTKNPNLILTADEAYDLDNDGLFGTNNFEMKDLSTGQDNRILNKNLQIDDDDLLNEIQEESHQQGLDDQIKLLLQNGPNVYELYSVMIHSGGALGGHYYAYIKSFENDRWYCFNDSTVDRIKWKQVQHMFGDKVPKYNTGVSAYFLMYRQVTLEKNKLMPQIPPLLEKQLNETMAQENLKKEKEELEKREKALEIRLRIFYKEKDNIIRCKKSDTLQQLKEECMKVLNVQEDPDDSRLRFYNYSDKFMLETFTGKEDNTLAELRFNEYKSIIIDTKDPLDHFEEYDSKLMMLKINIWKPDIQAVDESRLKPTRIFIHDDKKLPDLLELISKVGNIDVEKILLQKKNSLGQKFFSEILNLNAEQRQQSFFLLNIVNCLNLYVEEADPKWQVGQPTKWDKEFEADKFRCTIIYNDPRGAIPDQVPEYNFEISIDSRLPLFDLKERIADILGIEQNSFIIKRGSRFNPELRDLSTAIKDNGIIGRGTLYLLIGQPSVIGQYKINVGMGGLSKRNADSIEYDYEELFQIVISNDQTVYQLKELLCKEVQSRQNIILNPKQIRLREKVALKFGKIFNNEDSLKTSKIYDRQPFVLENLNHEEQNTQGQYLTYVKLFNLIDFELSYPPEEFFIAQTQTFNEFAVLLSERFQIPIDEIEACKINNIYNFSIDDLVLTQHDWLQMNNMNAELGKQPWYIMKDCNFIIIRDRRTVPEDISQFQQRAKDSKLKKASLTDHKQFTNLPTQKNTQPKEKALTIKVVKKEQPVQLQNEILDEEVK